MSRIELIKLSTIVYTVGFSGSALVPYRSAPVRH